ncbi:MAG: FkbM family methyltransferase [Opitutaceae bacterium]
MSFIDELFLDPELQAAPPVLVDVGASGGTHDLWQQIARHSIGVGFEPDRREISALAPAQQNFRRWVFSDRLVVADQDARETKLYLTRSPFCSSTLLPDSSALAKWSFAELFEVVDSRTCPATTLQSLLQQHGLEHLDWLKCDTQGTDLRIFQSLPPARRSRVLAVEFEPGIIDAYHGEDKFSDILVAMQSEPYWLAKLEVHGVPRGSSEMLDRRLGVTWGRQYRRLGPIGPGWVNATYLRRFSLKDDLGRREFLLGWIFASLFGQPAEALQVAEIGKQKFGDPLFDRLAKASVRQMRQCVLRPWSRWPGIIWGKLTGG